MKKIQEKFMNETLLKFFDFKFIAVSIKKLSLLDLANLLRLQTISFITCVNINHNIQSFCCYYVY